MSPTHEVLRVGRCGSRQGEVVMADAPLSTTNINSSFYYGSLDVPSHPDSQV